MSVAMYGGHRRCVIGKLTGKHLRPILVSHYLRSLPHNGTSILGCGRCSWKNARTQHSILAGSAMAEQAGQPLSVELGHRDPLMKVNETGNSKIALP